MKALEWTNRDKSEWPRGEWDEEPDKVQWSDPATGLPCLIVRGPAGALCGYVGVGPSHPWYRRGYTDCSLPNPCGEEYCRHSIGSQLDCHGGLTFSGSCDEGAPEGRGICHVAEPGDFEPARWFGFDCAHGCDVTPANKYDRGEWNSTYKSLAYVRREVTALAIQMSGAQAQQLRRP